MCIQSFPVEVVRVAEDEVVEAKVTEEEDQVNSLTLAEEEDLGHPMYNSRRQYNRLHYNQLHTVTCHRFFLGRQV